MNRLHFFVAVAAAFVATVTVTTADAHIALTAPTARYDDQKVGPCGRGADDARTTNVSTFRSGETITVTWKETIPHPGHFRISFSADGVKGIVDPKSFTELNSAPSVIKDGIADKTGTQTYSEQITLPDVACDSCTLQVVQVMTDKAPYGDGNDLYYQCADLVLTKDGVASDAGPDAGTTPINPVATNESGGCTTTRAYGASGAASLASLLAGAWVVIARRRKARARGPL